MRRLLLILALLSTTLSTTLALADPASTPPLTPTRPVGEVLADLLKPKAKHLHRGDSGNAAEMFWVADDGTVPGAVATLSRLKADAAAWSFTLAYPGNPAVALTIRDFGRVSPMCLGYYKIVAGPLQGALVWDQGRGAFTVASGAYNKRSTLAGWHCGDRVLE